MFFWITNETHLTYATERPLGNELG